MPENRGLKSAKEEIHRHKEKYQQEERENSRRYNRYLRRLGEDINELFRRGWIQYPNKGEQHG